MNSRQPRITLITPSRNLGSFIGETIESVAAQRYANLEYLIIDGASTDETAAVVERYSSTVTDFISEPDRGQAHAINKGLERGTGEIFGWLNADDLLEPGALETVARLHTQTHIPFIYGDGWKVWHGMPLRRRVRPGKIDPQQLRVRDYILQPSAFWTREVIDRIGFLDETLHYVFDWDFFVRISLEFPMRYLPAPLSTYRIRPGHKSSVGGKARAAEIMRVIERYAPAEWKPIFQDLWLRYDSLSASRKVGRLARTALLLLKEPRLMLRHGPRRLGLAALTLL